MLHVVKAKSLSNELVRIFIPCPLNRESAHYTSKCKCNASMSFQISRVGDEFSKMVIDEVLLLNTQ